MSAPELHECNRGCRPGEYAGDQDCRQCHEMQLRVRRIAASMGLEGGHAPEHFELPNLRRHFPKVVGNALICSDGTTHQLRLLDRLYLRCGITTPAALEKAYSNNQT
jgi:hypothetical protein